MMRVTMCLHRMAQPSDKMQCSSVCSACSACSACSVCSVYSVWLGMGMLFRMIRKTQETDCGDAKADDERRDE